MVKILSSLKKIYKKRVSKWYQNIQNISTSHYEKVFLKLETFYHALKRKSKSSGMQHKEFHNLLVDISGDFVTPFSFFGFTAECTKDVFFVHPDFICLIGTMKWLLSIPSYFRGHKTNINLIVVNFFDFTNIWFIIINCCDVFIDSTVIHSSFISFCHNFYIKILPRAL